MENLGICGIARVDQHVSSIRGVPGASLAGQFWSETECWLGSFVILQGEGGSIPVFLMKPVSL